MQFIIKLADTKKHGQLLRKAGFKKLNPYSPYFPVGGPDGFDGSSVWERTLRDTTHQIGVNSDGSWDHCWDENGMKVTEGRSARSLETDLRRMQKVSKRRA